MTCMLMVNFSRATSLPFLTVFVDCARFGLLGPVLEHMAGRPSNCSRSRSPGSRSVRRLGLCDWDVEKYGHSTCVCSNKIGTEIPLVKHGSFRRFWWLFLDSHPKLGLWWFKGSRPGHFALLSGRCRLGWCKASERKLDWMRKSLDCCNDLMIAWGSTENHGCYSRISWFLGHFPLHPWAGVKIGTPRKWMV